MTATIVSMPAAAVPRALRVQVAALQHEVWPDGDPPDRAADPGPRHDPLLLPRSFLLVDDGRVLAALDVLSKPIDHDGERYEASGLSTVLTDPAVQRRGHGRRLVTAAREAMAASGADLGVFTCDRPLAPFYEAAGWGVVPGAVLVGGTPEAPFPSDRFDKVVLACFFSSRARAAAGSFAHRRIALYPGEIDRLW